MKKSILGSLLCIIMLLIPKAFAVKHIDVKVNSHGDRYKSIVLYIREGKEEKYFWSCRFLGKGQDFDKHIKKFLDKINGLTVSSVSPIYKSLEEACKEYDNLRYARSDDFENNKIYLFDYSPDNEYFQTIIKNLKKLSNSHFKLDLLHSITIR